MFQSSAQLFFCCSYASTGESVLETYSQADAFTKLSAAATRVAQQHSEMPAGNIASMYFALLGFTGKVYLDKLDYIECSLSVPRLASMHLSFGLQCLYAAVSAGIDAVHDMV